MPPLRRLLVAVPLTAFLLAACGKDDPTSPTVGPAVLLIAGHAGTDTIGTRPTQALVVEVLDEDGEPLPDATVRFETSSLGLPAGSPFMAMAPVGEQPQWGLMTQETDARGRAVVEIRYGPYAGAAWIAVVVPELGLSDTARYTVRPGKTSGLRILPREASVFVGGSVTFSAVAMDRYGNTVPRDATFSTTSTTIAFEERRATGTTFGIAKIFATADGATDSSFVYVVPEATIAAGSGSGVKVFNADGSGMRTIATHPAFTTAWSPARDEVAFDHPWEGGIRIADLDGNVRMVSDGSGHALYPDFSPDGETVYFSLGGWRLWRASRLGTGNELVPMDLPTSDGAPSLSPDGTSLMYVQLRGGAQDVIRRLDLQTGAVTALDVPGHSPAWSPLGEVVAYMSWPNARLFLMAPDGTNRRQIGNAAHSYGFGMDWSPDGKWLVVRNESRNQLELIGIENGHILPLPFTIGMTGPSWRP